MVRAIRATMALAAAAAVLLTLGVGQVGASHVGCGGTLTADTWLDEDLDCSASGTDGLIIGADNITLDFHGFELKGQFGTRDGIVNEGYDRVKIRNGTVTTWDAAVLLRDTRRNHIIGLTITSSDQGLVMLGGDRNLVKRNDSNAHGGQGFDIDDVTRSRFLYNTTSGNFNGFEISNSTRNTFARNSVDGPSNTGIEVMTSHANRFVRNRVIDGRLHGFDVSQSDRNVFIKNFMDGNDGEGLTLGDSDRNWLKGNHVLRGMRQGFNVGGGSSDNHFIGNRVEMNDVSGFNIGSGSNNRLIANLAIRNGNDGILTLEPTTFLQFNLLLRNDDLGVSAPSGAIDGGGNVAFGNGNPTQCVGVVCIP